MFGIFKRPPPSRTLLSHSESITGYRQSPDSRWIASCSPKEIRIWDLLTGEQRGEPIVIEEGVLEYRIRFGPKGKVLAIPRKDGYVDVFDLSTNELHSEVFQIDMPMQGLEFSPDGQWFVAVSGKQSKIWNFETRELVSRLSWIWNQKVLR